MFKFIFASVPSKVWTTCGPDSSRASLFVGGFKSAVNLDFLKSQNVRLIVNTASGIENMFLGHKARECDDARIQKGDELISSIS